MQRKKVLPDVWLGNMDCVLSGLSSRTPSIESLREQAEWKLKEQRRETNEKEKEKEQAKQEKII